MAVSLGSGLNQFFSFEDVTGKRAEVACSRALGADGGGKLDVTRQLCHLQTHNLVALAQLSSQEGMHCPTIAALLLGYYTSKAK